jgi:hypothetical protein
VAWQLFGGFGEFEFYGSGQFLRQNGLLERLAGAPYGSGSGRAASSGRLMTLGEGICTFSIRSGQ